MNEETTTKALNFDALQIGDKFYVSRGQASLSEDPYTKVASEKNNQGTWANAKNGKGFPYFVKYDTRVWVKK